MSCFKCCTQNVKKGRAKSTREDSDSDNDDRQRKEEEKTTLITDQNIEEEEVTNDDPTKLVYFASTIPNQNVIDIVNVLHKDVQVSL